MQMKKKPLKSSLTNIISSLIWCKTNIVEAIAIPIPIPIAVICEHWTARFSFFFFPFIKLKAAIILCRNECFRMKMQRNNFGFSSNSTDSITMIDRLGSFVCSNSVFSFSLDGTNVFQFHSHGFSRRKKNFKLEKDLLTWNGSSNDDFFRFNYFYLNYFIRFLFRNLKVCDDKKTLFAIEWKALKTGFEREQNSLSVHPVFLSRLGWWMKKKRPQKCLPIENRGLLWKTKYFKRFNRFRK